MAGSDRAYRNPELEIDPMTVSAAETQRIARRMRDQGRERRPQRLEADDAEPRRVSLSAGWDKRTGRPIPR